MLQRLTIQNYALIDSLTISFPGDLVIITGETGAGKSIVIGALSLLLGSRTDVSVVSDKEKNCVVEGEFSLDGEEIILRRVITPAGRSRIFMNDEPATIEDLKGVSSKLIDIHAQHNHLLLAERKFQMKVIDSYCGACDLLSRYSEHYQEYLATAAEIKEVDALIAKSDREREYTEHLYKQLCDAKLREGELQDLEAEQSRLSNSEEIKESLGAIESLFSNELYSITQKLKEAESIIGKLSKYIPQFEEFSQRVYSARVELKDIESEVSAASERVVYSPERLLEVDNRLALIHDLMRKHTVSTEIELIEKQRELEAKLGENADHHEKRGALLKREAELKRTCEEEAQQLHIMRSEAAPKLAETLQERIRGLEMPLAHLQIVVSKCGTFGKDGKDDIFFNFSANGSQELKEISKCASGGELSRIMLCIKANMAKYTGMPTMIFDEIDTGISGSIADKMGEVIGEMGHSMQVFAITHLPQVASKGDTHYLVYKESNETGEVKTKIRKIEGEERLMEIARMLSGSKLTPEAVANAKVLLGNNQLN